MYFTLVGRVMKIDTPTPKLSIVALAVPGSGQVVTDGKWGQRGDGFFNLKVWKDSKQAGSNFDFSQFLEKTKPGSYVEVLVEGVDTKTIKDGEVTRRELSLTALKFSYISVGKPGERAETHESERPVRTATAGSDEDFQDVSSDEDEDQEDWAPDPFN
jgi:hypothetical protein